MLANQAFAERETVVHPFDAEERIHGSIGLGNAHPLYPLEFPNQEIAGEPEALEGMCDHRLPLLERGKPRTLDEHGRVSEVEGSPSV